MTTVRADRYVNCPFSAVVEFAQAEIDGSASVHLTPGPPLGEAARVAARATPDLSDESRVHDALLIAWTPEHRALFPNFKGALTARPAGRGTWLRLRGDYRPPFGLAGRFFDALAGRFIARSTMNKFLSSLGTSIERRWQFERMYVHATRS